MNALLTISFYVLASIALGLIACLVVGFVFSVVNVSGAKVHRAKTEVSMRTIYEKMTRPPVHAVGFSIKGKDIEMDVGGVAYCELPVGQKVSIAYSIGRLNRKVYPLEIQAV